MKKAQGYEVTESQLNRMIELLRTAWDESSNNKKAEIADVIFELEQMKESTHVNNEEIIVKNCNQRDNMGDCFLLKETTEAMCAVIALARQEINSWANPSSSVFYEALKKFDAMVIE